MLLGEKATIAEPLLNGSVLGQDTVMAVKYLGKLYWFWGDTLRAKYPLGHFGTAGAVSELPERGGLDPSVGINLKYFTGDDGFSRPLIKLEGQGPIWIPGTLSIADPTGRERLVTHYMRMKNLGETLEHGIAVFNDGAERFDKLVEFDLKDKAHRPQSHPVRVRDAEGDYFYFPAPYANVRVKAEWASLTNQASYEAFTCVTGNGASKTADAKVARDGKGQAVYAWRKGVEPLSSKEERELVNANQLSAKEAHFQTVDVDSGKAVDLQTGSAFWNEFRKRWVMIAQQSGGTSFMGEIWFAEAESITGPWPLARKIVSHQRYTFYNPTQHPFFDQEGGRVIYFEGTYTEQFSGNPVATPRYDYNQIMYRLDLGDPRLGLPIKGKQ